MPHEAFSNLEHQIRRYQDDLAKQAKELSELRSELARLKQIMGTVREALRCIDTDSYKGGMTSDAEKKAHAQLAEFMNKGF
jgi:septal ring factor EnvC (AmiA/AmiB activator)